MNINGLGEGPGAHLRAKGKLMEVLAEKLRGLSKGLLPAVGRKGEKSPRYRPRCDAQGATGCCFRGKRGQFTSQAIPSWKRHLQPGASPLLLTGAAEAEGSPATPPKYLGHFGRWSTHPLGTALTCRHGEGGERPREGRRGGAHH